ncbi:ABC transporter substrate-binding protein [Lactobacillus sp. CC-MHH1034]|uniref:ABC transporter substrate-binding protein n=1 Tax=Agrilactobacillus fermenti TaxID=2586909 RepID=UPI001E577B42|nr:ABC transporter substrate-binding protein [Agrilactobacillus fermenti]MCD2257008.1 ABC transporter substrate-binding protein [Agrilactobacillus fermenti]
MKKLGRVLILFFALILVLTGCAQSQRSADEKLTQITLALDYTPNTNHTGLYVAQSKGYFKKYGLKVKFIQPPQNGPEGLIGARKAQFGVSYQDVMAGVITGKNKQPITAIAALVQHNTSGIMSRKADNITRPKDMTNKRYATWGLPIEQAIIKEVVDQDGGNYKKIKLVPSNFNDEVAGLKSKKIDSIWVYEGWAVQNAKIQNYPVNYFAFRDVNPTFDYYTPVLVGNNTYMKQHPQVTRKLVRAVSQGYAYAAKHPQASADILKAANPELKKGKSGALVDASQQYLSKQYIADAKQFGYIDAGRWNKFYTWLNEHKLVKGQLTKNQGFTNKYLPKEK